MKVRTSCLVVAVAGNGTKGYSTPGVEAETPLNETPANANESAREWNCK